MEMIEKIAGILRIEPYHFFKNRADNGAVSGTETLFPSLPSSMKKQIKTQIDVSMSKVLTEILDKY